MADVSKRVQKAEKYLLKGKTREALEEYLLAYKEDPANDSLVEIIAELYLKQNEPERALQCYGYLFDKNVEQQNGSGAVLVYRKMARLGSKDIERLYTCAAFLEKDKPHEAREAYRTCAQSFEEGGDKVRALEALGRLAALEAANPDVQAQMGRLAESMGNPDQAVQCYVRAAKLSHGAKALEWLTRAHGLLPRDQEIGGLVGTALFSAGRIPEAAAVLEPVSPSAFPDRNRLLAQCYLQIGRFDRAEELLWGLLDRMPEAFDPLLRLAERYIEDGTVDRALGMVPRLKHEMFARSKDKQFQAWVEKLREGRAPSVPLLRLVADAYKEMNMDSRRTEVNAELFEVAMEASEYAQAASALEVLADLDSDIRENDDRLQRLSGKVSEEEFRSLSSQIRRFAKSGTAAGMGGGAAVRDWREEGAPQAAAGGAALDSALLQAELLLQFSGPEAAAESLRKLLVTYPGEEQNNARLRGLMVETRLLSPEEAATMAVAQASPGTSASVADFRRITDITRNIHRQATVKEILSLVVNEIGRGWNPSRCLAGLCIPGRPPTAALEYCAAGIRRSDPASVLQLITALSQATAEGKPLATDDAVSAPALAPIARVLQSLAVSSLLALPLIDAGRQTGVIVLEQCGHARRWDAGEVDLLATIADQVVLAVSQLKLRSMVDAVADEQSGLVARSAYLDYLVRECERAQKQRTPLCAALLEFCLPDGTPPAPSDSDRIMREAAEVLRSQLRSGDIGVRYDTAALAMVFPSTRSADAVPLIEKVRRLTAAIRGNGGNGLRVTCGLAEALVDEEMDPADSVTEWINRLEAAMEIARRSAVNSAELPPPK